MSFSPTEHHWSGWPGAFCFKCGAEDPMEIALADGWYDPWTDTWDTEEHKEQVNAAQRCPVIGRLVWDDDKKDWNLI